jgi:hypothetical protein
VRPQLRADDVTELDLRLAVELPPVDAAAADEDAGRVAEHPDPEAVLAPVGEPVLEPLACLRGRQARRDDPRIPMQLRELVEIGFGERKPAKPTRDQWSHRR